MERLQKVIANSGYTSRRKAEELITEKRVKVNDEIISELGYKVSKDDQIKIDDILLEKDPKVYILLNKPRGYVSTTSDDKGRKTILDLIDTNVRIYPIGRLDYDTTGLILLTNDGELANLIMHPKNQIDKVYVAKAKGNLTGYKIKKLREGVFIDGVKTSPAKVKEKSYDKKNNTYIIEITIHEGKNHQVKKMLESVGMDVLKLKREKIGFLTLDGLNSKEYRYLTIKEVQRLYSLAKNK